MNWVPFAVAAWIAFGLELGLSGLIAKRFGTIVVEPSFVMPLAVFVALGAPHTHAIWACLLLGLLLDLTRPPSLEGGLGTLVVIGPGALGYLVAAQLVLSLRPMVIRRNPLTLGVLSALAALVASLVLVAVFTIRAAFDDPVVWSTWPQFAGRAASSLYTGLVGVFMGWVLIRLSPAFGFNLGHRHLPIRSYERH